MLTSQTIKTIQDIMRKDVGVDGDAQRIGQLGWMIFLKTLDDQEQEFELLDDKYRSPIPGKVRWRNWAADSEGITGDTLLDFVNNELFRGLKNLPNGNPRALVIRSAFEDAYNYMKSGTLMRQVVNKLNEDFDFNRLDDRHIFNDIYEQILKDLQSAGNAGEYYTPRAVTQFAVEMIDPKLGETVLDPACGTGGFLTCAIEHVRKRYVKSVEDEDKLQRSIQGVDKKQLPHLLAVTNMLLHGIAVPSNIRHDNTLARPLRDYGPRDRVDVIVTNPPFGGMEEDGIELNFPQALRTRETADLFLVLLMHLLKDGGRAAIVLPDGTLFGEGVKTRIKEKLLTECNLQTIVRLPNGVFNPYTGIKTNILFFEKGKPTRHIWYYEHPYPAGQKSYNKTNPIRIEEFEPEKKWRKKRVENEHAWKVDFKKLIDETKARAQSHWEAVEKYEKEALNKKGDEQERLETLARSELSAGDSIYATAFNLDRKNPNSAEDGPRDPDKLLVQLKKVDAIICAMRERLRTELAAAFER
jgi:type I restriction enzyme M protein